MTGVIKNIIVIIQESKVRFYLLTKEKYQYYSESTLKIVGKLCDFKFNNF